LFVSCGVFSVGYFCGCWYPMLTGWLGCSPPPPPSGVSVRVTLAVKLKLTTELHHVPTNHDPLDCPHCASVNVRFVVVTRDEVARNYGESPSTQKILERIEMARRSVSGDPTTRVCVVKEGVV
jgi:hypothetical protein